MTIEAISVEGGGSQGGTGCAASGEEDQGRSSSPPINNGSRSSPQLYDENFHSIESSQKNESNGTFDASIVATESSNSRGVKGIRKTISKWLRIQKPSNKEGNRSRYRLTGWPPRWVRRRSPSPDSRQKQRALPPVPLLSTHTIDEDRMSTPELRPEDFPPGVAYLPDGDDDDPEEDFPSKNTMIDFASTIETVKTCDWYWGPISSDAAEQVLQYEPDGSFLVRDSSDDRHIFSLTFKLNGTVRHVRIEHDQGNFSFGSFTRFKSKTIVDFVDNAVEFSRSGRYLFFLNRRLPNGPMRVQLLHPVSRVKKVQSLQHMCRFVILKLVPRDHVDQLPVPKRIKNYLKTPNYYSENIHMDESEEMSPEAELLLNQQASDSQNLVPPQQPQSHHEDENLYLANNFQNVQEETERI